MATREVVYDDQDSQIIQYSGQWFTNTSAEENVGNFGPPYLHTLHGTNHDASISFEFDGTAIGVYGTSNVVNQNTNPDPTLECFVDGVSIGRETIFEFPENNWKLCGKGGFSAGLHKLQIDIKVQSPDQTFWLDQIRYIPSPSLGLDDATIQVTNMDPAIRLDDKWGSLAEFNSTTKTNAVALVDFFGTSVSWVGYIPAELPHGSASGTYSIDGGEPVNFNLAGIPEGSTTSMYTQTFFTTTDVEKGHHTLTVTFLGSDRTTPLTLDHLYIKSGSLLPASPSNSTTSSPANTSAFTTQPGRLTRATDSNIMTATNTITNTSTVTSVGTVSNPSTVTSVGTVSNPSTVTSVGTVSNPSTTPSAKAVSNSGSSDDGGSPGLNISALLGGILGGLGLLILFAAAFLYRRHRRLSRGNVVQPFRGRGSVSMPSNHYSNMQSTASLDDIPHPNTMAQATYGCVPLWASRASARRREAGSYGGSDSVGSSVLHRTVPSGSEGSSGRVHTDSGVRLNQSLVEDIPPHYTPEA